MKKHLQFVHAADQQDVKSKCSQCGKVNNKNN